MTRRVGVVAVAASCLAVFLAGGSIFGFAALQDALLGDNLFASLCERNVARPCAAQQDRLSLLFSLAVGLLYCAVMPVGLFMDELGPGVVMLFGSVFAAAGFVLVAVFPSADLAWSVAIPLWGVCSPCLFLSALSLPRFFGPRSSHVTMLVICCFDTGSAVLLGLLLQSTRSAYLAAIGGTVLAAGIVAAVSLPSVAQVRALDSDSSMTDLEPVAASLKQINFWIATGFIAFWSMKNSFYLASFEAIWRTFSPDTAKTAVFVLNCAMPVAGVLSLPLGMALFKFSNAWLFAVVVAVGVAYSGLNFAANDIAQYCGVALYSLMRPLKWGVVSHFVLSSFPLYNCGRLFGVLNVATGIVSLLQYAGMAIAIRSESFFGVLLGFTILGALTAMVPIRLAVSKR